MNGEPVGTNPRLIDESAFYHVPAPGTNGTNPQDNGNIFFNKWPVEPAFPVKEDQLKDEEHADGAAKQAVYEFPPEDGFKTGEGHSLIHEFILRGLLIGFESLFPLVMSQGRDYPGYHVPVHNGKSGAG